MRRATIFALLILLLVFARSSPADVAGYWRFEEGAGGVAADSSGNGMDGVLFNGATFDSACAAVDTIPQTCQPDRFGLHIEGAGGVLVDDAAFLRPDSAITLEAFLLLEADAWVLLGMQLGIPPWHHNSYQIEFRPSQVGYVTFRLFDENGTHDVNAQTSIQPGEWHHIAGTWDGQTMRLYVDCEIVGSTPFSGRILYVGDRPFIIGGDSDVEEGVPSCCYFHRCIDEVRISDRALDPAEFLAKEGDCGVPSGLPGEAGAGGAALRAAVLPNPAGDRVTFRVVPMAQGIHALRIFDVRGRLVGKLHETVLKEGVRHTWIWDGMPRTGGPAAGVYFYTLSGPGTRQTGRFVAIR
jgi:hypothetical protein